jgi:hypothetical protein
MTGTDGAQPRTIIFVTEGGAQERERKRRQTVRQTENNGCPKEERGESISEEQVQR